MKMLTFSNYLNTLKVMLKSLFFNSPNEHFSIFLMHSSLGSEELRDLDQYTGKHDQELKIVPADDSCFQDAPVIFHYTKEMYYRSAL
jgi:lipopolysaccharide biosynthesis glycosyltransferase